MATLDQLKKIFQEKLDLAPDQVTPEKSFRELSVDSLDLYELIYEVENVFGVTIPDDKAVEMEKVQDIIDYIDKQK